VWSAPFTATQLSALPLAATEHKWLQAAWMVQSGSNPISVHALFSHCACCRIFDVVDFKKVATVTAGPMETWTVTWHPKRDLIATGTQSGNIGVLQLPSFHSW